MPTCQSNLVDPLNLEDILFSLVLHSTGSKNYFALLFIPYLDTFVVREIL